MRLLALCLALLLAPVAGAQRRALPRTAARAPAPAALLQSGPMLGYALHREVVVWAQTTAPARVQVRYWNEAAPAQRWTTPAVATTAADAFTAHVTIAGLEPGQHYGYSLLINGRVVPRPYPTRFATQSLWQWRTDPPAFTFALGSCTYVNEEPVRPARHALRRRV